MTAISYSPLPKVFPAQASAGSRENYFLTLKERLAVAGMIRCIAIDREKSSLQYLADMVSRTSGLTLAKTYASLQSAFEELEAQVIAADIIFVDIQTALDEHGMFTKELPVYASVILTANHPQYKLHGCRMDIVDHLIKPFTLERFKRAITKVNISREQSDNNVHLHSTQLLIPGTDDYIFLRHADRIIRLWLNDIFYLESVDGYVTLQTLAGKIVVLESLEKFTELLRPYRFSAINPNVIVSIKYIDEIAGNTLRLQSYSFEIEEAHSEHFFRFIE